MMFASPEKIHESCARAGAAVTVSAHTKNARTNERGLNGTRRRSYFRDWGSAAVGKRARTRVLALIQPFGRVGVRLGLLQPIEDPAVEQLLVVGDRLEEQSVAGDLEDHEMMLRHGHVVEGALGHAV